MASYLLGSTIRLTVTFAVAGTPADPSTIALEVGDRTGDPATYTYALAEITRASAGVYWKEVTPDAAGTWVAIWTGTGDVDAVEVQEFDVVAPAAPWDDAPPVYASLAELKMALGITGDTEDTALHRVLESASRHIENETNRLFYAGDAGEVRYYTRESGDLWIDEALDVTAIAVDTNGQRLWDTPVETTDYWLVRLRGVPGVTPVTHVTPARGAYGRPWGWYPSWCSAPNDVQVTGTFGSCATGAHPAPIREACLLLAAALWKRKDAVFGVLEGTLDAEPVRISRDQHVVQLLRPYVKARWVFA